MCAADCAYSTYGGHCISLHCTYMMRAVCVCAGRAAQSSQQCCVLSQCWRYRRESHLLNEHWLQLDGANVVPAQQLQHSTAQHGVATQYVRDAHRLSWPLNTKAAFLLTSPSHRPLLPSPAPPLLGSLAAFPSRPSPPLPSLPPLRPCSRACLTTLPK